LLIASLVITFSSLLVEDSSRQFLVRGALVWLLWLLLMVIAVITESIVDAHKARRLHSPIGMRDGIGDLASPAENAPGATALEKDEIWVAGCDLELTEWVMEPEERYGVDLGERFHAANVGELCDSLSAAIIAARDGVGLGAETDVEQALFKRLSANYPTIPRSTTFLAGGLQSVYRDGIFSLWTVRDHAQTSPAVLNDGAHDPTPHARPVACA
jgi:hypothetical protein